MTQNNDMDDLSWKTILNFRRMRHIKRCNNFPVLNSEDVAQHSYYTTMLCTLVNDELRLYCYENKCTIDKNFSTESLIRKALFHDLDETFTSDIPYPVKHNCDAKLEQDFQAHLLSISEKFISSSFVSKCWGTESRESKEGLTGKIVKFCDMLELALYSYEEVCLGNKNLIPVLDNCNKYLNELYDNMVKGLSDMIKTEDSGGIILPITTKLLNLVQRDPDTGNYNMECYVIDIS